MSTADRFDRHLESLLAELTGPQMPAYIDDALATATARPQRGPSILSRFGAGTAGPRYRMALVGLPVVLVLAAAIVGLLVIGNQNPTPSPTPNAPSAGPTETSEASPVPTTKPTPTPAPSLGTCDGYARAADARVVDAVGEQPWETEKVVSPPAFSSLGDGVIAGFAEQLGSGPAVVLIDPADGTACRLVDLESAADLWELEWSPLGDALAIAVGKQVLVWSAAGLTQVLRLADTGFGVTLAWSPAGEAIAIGSGSPIAVVFADGSRRSVAIQHATSLAWSPDASRFAAIGVDTDDPEDTRRLVVISGDGLVIDPIDERAGLAGWLDGQTILAGSSTDAGALEAFDLGPRTWRTWSPASTEPIGLTSIIGYAPGLTGLAFFANDDINVLAAPVDLIVRDLPSGERHVLATKAYPPSNAFGTGAWSPDGTHIAVSVIGDPTDPRARPGVSIYALAGGDPTFVSPIQVILTEGSWQPVP
jgi:hypothetical protein